MPRSANSATGPGERFQTESSWPAASSRRAIGAPIRPSPRTATRIACDYTDLPRPRVHVTGRVPAAVDAALREAFELVETPVGADGILSLLVTTSTTPTSSGRARGSVWSRTTRLA